MYEKKLRLRVASGSLAICLCVMIPLQSHAQPHEDAQSYTQEVANSVSSAVAETPSSGGEVASTKVADGFEAQTEDIVVSVPNKPTPEVITTDNSTSRGKQTITIGLNGADLEEGQLASDGSVVFKGKGNMSQTVQATQEGVRIHNVIESEDGPTEFVHTLGLPEGTKLVHASELELSDEDAEDAAATREQVESNSNDEDPIIIVDNNNEFIAGFGRAWAKDASGADVPTNYEIRDGALVQKVEHNAGSVQYPIVADPYLFWDLVKSAEWVEHEDGWTLNVTPTGFARAAAFDYPHNTFSIGSLGWSELYDKYKDQGRGIKHNLGGMRDQWICHQQIVAIRAPGKETWNLDEWRPDVSYIETVNTQCNPGGPRLFD